MGQQGKHIIGAHNVMEDRSLFKVGVNPQELLNEVHSGTHKVVGYNKGGMPIVDFGKTIGIDGRSKLGTSLGTIHYGKKGAHIVPALTHEIRR